MEFFIDTLFGTFLCLFLIITWRRHESVCDQRRAKNDSHNNYNDDQLMAANNMLRPPKIPHRDFFIFAEELQEIII